MLVRELAIRDHRFRLGMLGGGMACLLGVLAVCTRTSLFGSRDESSGPLRQTSAYYAPEGGEGFELPGDRAGQMLALLLPPRGLPAAEQEPGRKPRSYPVPRSSLPVVPPPQRLMETPSLPRSPRKDLRPSLVLDEVFDDVQDPILPEPVAFSVDIRTGAEDGSSPPASELPALAQPVLDRVSLEDPTGDGSTAAALAAPMPVRSTLAPFLRLTVPDPYDHRRTLKVPDLPEEQAPHTTSPQTPGR